MTQSTGKSVVTVRMLERFVYCCHEKSRKPWQLFEERVSPVFVQNRLGIDWKKKIKPRLEAKKSAKKPKTLVWWIKDSLTKITRESSHNGVRSTRIFVYKFENSAKYVSYLFSDTVTQSKNVIPTRKEINEVIPTIVLIESLEVLSHHGPHREIQTKTGCEDKHWVWGLWNIWNLQYGVLERMNYT